VDDLTLDVAVKDVTVAEDTAVDVWALDVAAEDVADAAEDVADAEEAVADVWVLDVAAEDMADADAGDEDETVVDGSTDDVVLGPKEVEIGVWLMLVNGLLVLGCAGGFAR
jgi:hypothetical protein